jgi:NADH-quinone oxidoreductase subunit L
MYSMGGLSQKMPFVRTVFIIGSLALAGLPIANGFFSKELILEEGLSHGPTWAYWCMLIGAGITALYTARMISLVFYHQPAQLEPSHDAPTAMRFSLAILSIGTFTTWLLAGPFSQILNETLPFHDLRYLQTFEMALEIIESPETWLALLVILIGISTWRFQHAFQAILKILRPISNFAKEGLGFDWVNAQIVKGIQSAATAIRYTQTGILSWNVLGIFGGLVILFIILAWGA